MSGALTGAAVQRTTRRAAHLTGRVTGLDLARAAALIGMFAAHVGDSGTRGSDSDGWEWLWIADGRPSALFAVLAGVTISLLTLRDRWGVGHASARIAARGVILLAAGYALDMLDTPVDVILTNLGLMFLLVIPALRVPTLALLGMGVALMVAGGLWWPEMVGTWDGVPVVEKFFSFNYPAIAWTGYVLVGMAVGRVDLRGWSTAVRVAVAGAVTAMCGYGAGALAGGALPWADAWEAGTQTPTWASVAPHSNTPFEMVGNAGIALLVIGSCLALTHTARGLFPALAFGSMSLTMYTAHLLVIAAVGPELVWEPSNVSLVAMTLALMTAAALWCVAAGPGPLEKLVSRASAGVAHALVGPRR